MRQTEAVEDMAALYESDFYQWTQKTAEQLRAARAEGIDFEHVAEEIQDMGKSERRHGEQRLAVLIAHVLKWDAQPERRGPGWAATIRTQRIRLLRLLRDNRSLKPQLAEALPSVYELGVLSAIRQTNLPTQHFPAACPYTIEELLRDYPGEAALNR
jgi:hypothetical protein